MNEQSILEIIIRAKDEASKVMGDVGKQTEKVGGSLQAMSKNLAMAGGIITGVGVAGGVMMADWITKAKDAEKYTAQLDAVLKSTGGVAGVTKDKVLELADSLSKMTTYDDEAIVSAQNMLLTFTNIKDNVFPDATKIVLDMSTALGQDLQGSAIQVGKALNDPILGVTALRRVGVNFTKQQQEMIEKLVKSGKTLEAQKFILQELQTEFGGSAEAVGKTFGGQLTILQTKIDNIKEALGSRLIPVITPLVEGISKLADKILAMNPATLDMIVKVTAITSVLAVVIGGIMSLIGVIGMLTIGFGALNLSMLPVLAIVAGVVLAVGALIAIAYYLRKAWNENLGGFQDKVRAVFEWIKTAFNNVVNFFVTAWANIVATFNSAITFIQNIPAMLGQFITNVGNFFVGLLVTIGQFILDTITFFNNLPFMILQALADLIFVKIPYMWGFLREYLSIVVPQIIENVINWFKQLPTRISDFLKQLHEDANKRVDQMKIDLIAWAISTVVNLVLWFNNLWQEAIRIFTALGKSIIDGFNSAWTWITTEVPAWGSRVGQFLSDLPSILENIFESAKQAVWNKLTETWNKVKEIWENIKQTFNDLMGKASEAEKAGAEAGKRKGENRLFGGWIPSTGLYRLHQGEYVVSPSMQRGNQSIDNRVLNQNKTIQLNAIVNSPTDFDVVLNKLSWALNNAY